MNNGLIGELKIEEDKNRELIQTVSSFFLVILSWYVYYVSITTEFTTNKVKFLDSFFNDLTEPIRNLINTGSIVLGIITTIIVFIGLINRELIKKTIDLGFTVAIINCTWVITGYVITGAFINNMINIVNKQFYG